MTKTELLALAECLRDQDADIPPAEPTPSRAAADLCEKLAALEPVAWRCEWNDEWSFRQYHDERDPLPQAWDDKPDSVSALHNLTGIIDHE